MTFESIFSNREAGMLTESATDSKPALEREVAQLMKVAADDYKLDEKFQELFVELAEWAHDHINDKEQMDSDEVDYIVDRFITDYLRNKVRD